MIDRFLSLKNEISLLDSKNNLVCFLVYGSMLASVGSPNDFDAIIVAKKIDSTLNNLFKILSKEHNKLDIHIYSEEEILSGLSFYTREYVLEYLSKGLCLYGENIFKTEYSKVDIHEYERSLLIRCVGKLQEVRKKYFFLASDHDEKLKYLQKYFLRISKSILVLHGNETHASLSGLKQNEINQKLFAIGLFDVLINIDGAKTVDEYFNLFDVVAVALIRCKKNFDLDAVPFG